MKRKTIAAITLGASLVLGTMWALSSTFDLSFACGGTIHATAPSPDKKMVAYAFERDCGATTDFVSFVVLKNAGEKLDLAADLNRDEIVFQTEGDYQPVLKWVSQDTLQISFPKGAPSSSEIWFQSARFLKYKIHYRGLS